MGTGLPVWASHRCIRLYAIKFQPLPLGLGAQCARTLSKLTEKANWRKGEEVFEVGLEVGGIGLSTSSPLSSTHCVYLVSDFGIENDDDLSHERGNGDNRLLSVVDKALIEGF